MRLLFPLILFAALPWTVLAGDSGFVGSAVCGECHQEALVAWRGPHHDLAMAEATPETVLGDFDDAEIQVQGVTSRFYRGPDGAYLVRTTRGSPPCECDTSE